MAAPSSTTWGAVKTDPDDGHQSRIGIYTSISSTSTTSTITIQVWFWSKFKVVDSVNTLYFNDNATSASTSRGSVSIATTSNSSWDTANQVKIYSTSVSRTRTASNSTISCSAKLSNIEDVNNQDLTVTATYTVPALSGVVKIYDGSKWRSAIPYIYDGSKWRQAIPYVYNGSAWKTCGQ